MYTFVQHTWPRGTTNKQYRSHLLDKLWPWLRSAKTNPDLISFLVLCLKFWLINQIYVWEDSSYIFTDNHDMNTSFKSQITLAGYSTLWNVISKKLVEEQQTQLSDTKSKYLHLDWLLNYLNKCRTSHNNYGNKEMMSFMILKQHMHDQV